MKSFLFLLLAVLYASTAVGETRFKVDSDKKIVRYFGEAKISDGSHSYAGVEKQAWADAVQYLYKNYKDLSDVIALADSSFKEVVPDLVKRLRSRNTTYHKDGVVQVIVEFSYVGYEKDKQDPFASYKQQSDKM